MTTIYISGKHRTWSSRRWIPVWKFCRRAKVRGISKAMEDENFDKIEIIVNGKPTKYLKIMNDRIYFKSILRPKIEMVKKRYLFGLINRDHLVNTPRSFLLEIKITYKDMEGPVIS